METEGLRREECAEWGVARGRSREAFSALVVPHQDRLYRLALRMSGNASDAEEIVQETFLLAYRNMASFRGESRFGTWLHRIAVNHALMRRRASRRRPTESLEVLPPAARVAVDVEVREATCELVDRRRRMQRVHDALDQLEPALRAALVLRDLEELSAEEAADILGISPAALRQRAHRARLQLRVLLGDFVRTEARATLLPSAVRVSAAGTGPA